MRRKVYIRAMYNPRSVWEYPIEVITSFAPDADMRVVEAIAAKMSDSDDFPYTWRYELKSVSIVVEERQDDDA